MEKKQLLAIILASTLTTHATFSEAFCSNTRQPNYVNKLQFLFPSLFRNDTDNACDKTLKDTHELHQLDKSYQSSSLTDKRFRSLSHSLLSESNYGSLSNNKHAQSEFKNVSPKPINEDLIPTLEGYKTVSE